MYQLPPLPLAPPGTCPLSTPKEIVFFEKCFNWPCFTPLLVFIYIYSFIIVSIFSIIIAVLLVFMLYAKCLPREYNYPVLIRIPPSVGPALDHMLRFWNFAGMTSSLRFYHELDPMGEFHGAYTFNQIRFTAGSLLSGRRNLGPHMGRRGIRD